MAEPQDAGIMATPGSRLYLALPHTANAALATALSAVLTAADIACLLLREPDATTIETLLPLAQEAGVAVLIENDVDLALASGADGVHLTDPSTYAAARKRLGSARIVGVVGGASRHEAIEAAETGADYVALDGALIAWWVDLMTVPAVALGASDIAACQTLATVGADFLWLDEWIWSDPAGASTVVAKL